MMRNVLLSRLEQLMLGATCELRPALAEGDPSMPFVDRGHKSMVVAARLHTARPTEHVGWCNPGVHGQQETPFPLSIRFHNVAAWPHTRMRAPVSSSADACPWSWRGWRLPTNSGVGRSGC